MSSEPQKTLRLNQFLARAGIASRRAAEELILEGRVTLNGAVVTELATSVDPARDSVKVDGNRIWLPEENAYFALYKPKEVVSTLEDPEGRPCLAAFLPPGFHGLFPVGRLDYHSEGLLLLTNDGELSNRLLHPRYKVVKTYQVKVKGDPPPGALDTLRRGILLEGRRTLPVAIRKIPSRETRHTWLQVEMSEGRKNQLREMFFRIEHPVIKLKRSSVGPVKLGAMKPGEWRPLSEEEVLALKAAADLAGGARDAQRVDKAPERPRRRSWPRGKVRKEADAGGRGAATRETGPPAGERRERKRPGAQPAPSRRRPHGEKPWAPRADGGETTPRHKGPRPAPPRKKPHGEKPRAPRSDGGETTPRHKGPRPAPHREGPRDVDRRGPRKKGAKQPLRGRGPRRRTR